MSAPAVAYRCPHCGLSRRTLRAFRRHSCIDVLIQRGLRLGDLRRTIWPSVEKDDAA